MVISVYCLIWLILIRENDYVVFNYSETQFLFFPIFLNALSIWPNGIVYFWLSGQSLCKAQRRAHSLSYVTGVVTPQSGCPLSQKIRFHLVNYLMVRTNGSQLYGSRKNSLNHIRFFLCLINKRFHLALQTGKKVILQMTAHWQSGFLKRWLIHLQLVQHCVVLSPLPVAEKVFSAS